MRRPHEQAGANSKRTRGAELFPLRSQLAVKRVVPRDRSALHEMSVTVRHARRLMT